MKLSTPRVDFRVDPSRYRHWRLAIDRPVATLTMHVNEGGGLVPGYELKLNSYDLGVDIELYDAVQRLRFEHPEVRVVVLTSGKEKVFCAGANIRMLAASPHPWKVNLCTFSNETRNGIEDATANSGQVYLAAVNGSAFGGGYELALACQHIMLIDDQSSVVSLPKVPLLGVGPGTGGLTRVIDKRHVRRDLADYFASKSEGVGGKKAVQWRLVDEAVPRARWQETVAERAADLAGRSARPADATGIELTPLEKVRTDHEISYRYVTALLQRGRGVAEITVSGPETDAPTEIAGAYERQAGFWPLAVTRELDDLILDLRTNEPELGTWVLRTRGDAGRVLAYDRLLLDNQDDWLANEIIHYLKRTLKRLDVTSRSLIALIEPGSCFAGSLLELALAADRSFQLSGVFGEADPDAEPAAVTVGEMNLRPLPMGNGLTRLETRYLGNDGDLAEVEKRAGEALEAEDAEPLGLVTFAPDGVDWAEEVYIAIEERASFSPDALNGLEANYRFAGPETVETKIFGRLSAWKNWVFNGPNASGLESMYLQEITQRVQQYEKRRSVIDASHSNVKDSPVSGAIEYMKGHMDEPISVAILAEGAHMSESAFAHLFKKCTSTSPYQFLKQLRFEHARDLLLENHTVSEAARRVGYSSLSHFISEFKRYFGETPRSYLQRLEGLESFNLHADVDQLAGPRLPTSARRRALQIQPCRNGHNSSRSPATRRLQEEETSLCTTNYDPCLAGSVTVSYSLPRASTRQVRLRVPGGPEFGQYRPCKHSWRWTMGSRPLDIADLEFQVGDHVCAFYNGGGSALDDIFVDYVSKGLRAGNKCACLSFADTASSVLGRIPGELMSREDILQFITENQAKGGFSVEAGLHTLEAMAKEALSDGYGRLWLIGDANFVARDLPPRSMKTWFTYEAEVNELVSRHPQFIMCLYDLDRWAGELVMSVLQTHPRIFVNGLVLSNPYYLPVRQFLEILDA